MSDESTAPEPTSQNFTLSPETVQALDAARTAQAQEGADDAPEPSPDPKPEPKAESKTEPKGEPKEEPAPEETKQKSPKDFLLEPDPEPEEPEGDKNKNLANLRQANKKLELELTALRRKAAGNEDYEALKAKYTELEQVVNMARAERSPEFKRVIEEQINPKVEIAKSLAPDQADKLEALLKASPSAARTKGLSEIVEDMDNFSAARLGAVINDIDAINLGKEAKLREFSAKFEAHLAAQDKISREARAKDQAETQASFDRILEAARQKMSFFTAKEGDDAYNQGVQERVDIAKRIATGQFEDKDDVAAFALMAAAAPAMSEALKQAEARIAELEKANKAATKAPSPGKSDKSDGASRSDFDPSKETYGQFVARRARSAGAFNN